MWNRWKTLPLGWKILVVALLIIFIILPLSSIIAPAVFATFLAPLGLTRWIPIRSRWKEPQIYPQIKEPIQILAKRFRVDPNWIYKIISIESGFIPNIVNSLGASGLWQLMPDTAAWLGVGPLSSYTPAKQIEILGKYWDKWKFTTFNSETDIYLSLLFPIAVNKPDSFVLESSELTAAAVAKANKLFDLDKSGSVTVGEIKKYIKAY